MMLKKYEGKILKIVIFAILILGGLIPLHYFILKDINKHNAIINSGYNEYINNNIYKYDYTYDMNYVMDNEDKITKKTTDFINYTTGKLELATGAQIVIMTVSNTDNIEKYATEMFNQMGIGDKEKNNGLLLLIDTEKRLVRLEVGTGLENLISNSKAKSILDSYFIPWAKDDNYEYAVTYTYMYLIQLLEDKYDIVIINDFVPSKTNKCVIDSYTCDYEKIKCFFMKTLYYISFIPYWIFTKIISAVLVIITFIALLFLGIKGKSSDGDDTSFTGGGGSSNGGGATGSF